MIQATQSGTGTTAPSMKRPSPLLSRPRCWRRPETSTIFRRWTTTRPIRTLPWWPGCGASSWRRTCGIWSWTVSMRCWTPRCTAQTCPAPTTTTPPSRGWGTALSLPRCWPSRYLIWNRPPIRRAAASGRLRTAPMPAGMAGGCSGAWRSREDNWVSNGGFTG